MGARPEGVEGYRKRYPLGAQMRVHHHPERAEESVLEINPEWANTRVFLKALVVAAFAGALQLASAVPRWSAALRGR